MNRNEPTIIGYRKSGAPIWLCQGGAPTRLEQIRARQAEIVERQAAIRAELLDIEQAPEPEGDDAARAQVLADRSSTVDELVDEFDTLDAEHTTLETEAAPLQERADRLERVRSASLSPSNRETGVREAPQVKIGRDPYADMEQVRAGYLAPQDLCSRALTAIENGPRHMDDRAKERCAELIDMGNSQSSLIARHMLLTGSPEYHEEFQEYMRTLGQVTGPRMRAAMSTAGSAGGYLVPFTLDPTIILTNAGVVDPIRSLATIKTIATTTWEGVTSAGVTAEWTDEGDEWADGSPTFTQPSITPKKADAWVAASYEIMADSGFANELGRLLADAKARLEAAAFATANTGATKPRGVVAAVAAVTASLVSAAATNAFAKADVYSVSDALRPRDASQASWIANKKIFNLIRQFDTAGGGAFWANLGMKTPSQLLDAPVYECSSMESAVTTGGLVLLAGNFKEYYIVDRVGMSLLYEPIVRGVTNGRPTGQGGWAAFWRVGADAVDPAAFRLLQLNSTVSAVALA